jgi:small-conductance mechanosensitive channel
MKFLFIFLLQAIGFASFAQIHKVYELDLLKYQVDSLNDEIKKLDSLLNQIKSQIKNDSSNFNKLKSDIAMQLSIYTRKKDSINKQEVKAKKELTDAKQENANLNKDSENKEKDLKKIENELTNYKQPTKIAELQNELFKLSNEISELNRKLKQPKANYTDSLNEISELISKKKQYLIKQYNQQRNQVDNSDNITTKESENLYKLKKELISLDISESQLLAASNYDIFFTLIQTANNLLSQPCDNANSNNWLQQLNNTSFNNVQLNKINYCKNLLANYSNAINKLADIFSPVSKSKLALLFGSPSPLFIEEAKKQIEELEANIEYKNYPFILQELRRLKSMVSKKDGAANNNFKCN